MQQAKSLLQLMDRVTDAAGVCLNQKRSWAACWWKDILLLMDWSPSEQRIRIRGPGFKFLHANTYSPRAQAFGLHLLYVSDDMRLLVEKGRSPLRTAPCAAPLLPLAPTAEDYQETP